MLKSSQDKNRNAEQDSDDLPLFPVHPYCRIHQDPTEEAADQRLKPCLSQTVDAGRRGGINKLGKSDSHKQSHDQCAQDIPQQPAEGHSKLIPAVLLHEEADLSRIEVEAKQAN